MGPEVVVCGAAAVARERIGRVLDEIRPSAIVLAGVCGGLDPSLSPGDLVLARSVLVPGRPELVPASPLLDTVRGALRRSGWPFVTAPLLTVERPLGSRREKTDVWNATGAAGVDMESHAVAAAARERGIPWIVLRAVLDPAGSELPVSLRSWTGEGDEPTVLAVAATRPWEWSAYLRLAFAWRRAAAALRAAAPTAAAALSAAPQQGAAPAVTLSSR
jgi:nucleoside phosphorylase